MRSQSLQFEESEFSSEWATETTANLNVKTETETWGSNTECDWMAAGQSLSSLNITVSCNNNSWTAYISVNFYTTYMIFTYNSIIMLTWSERSFRLSHSHITYKRYPPSHASIDNQSSIFFPLLWRPLDFSSDQYYPRWQLGWNEQRLIVRKIHIV